MLVKEAGFTLRDIRGTESRSVEERPRTDMIARFRRWCPFLDDPDPVRTYSVEKDPGLSEMEVLRLLIYHDEMEEIKQEEHEDSMREARRKNGNIGNQSTSSTPSTPSSTNTSVRRP